MTIFERWCSETRCVRLLREVSGRLRTTFERTAWLGPALATVVAVFVLVAGLERLGVLEPLELQLYDRAATTIAAGPVADPITIVAARETDFQKSWPLPDAELVLILNKILASRPAAVGVDIFRDRPIASDGTALLDLLKAHHEITWVFLPRSGHHPAVPPPQGLKPEADKAFPGQRGFADFPVDRDGVTRRGLLYMDDDHGKPQTSFAMAIASRYLSAVHIRPGPAPENPSWLKLGRTTFVPLGPREGGYAGVDAGGYSFLLDFSGPADRFKPSIYSLDELREDFVPPDRLTGRVVLLGANAESVRDSILTPLGRASGSGAPTPGIEVHARSIAQIIAAARDGLAPMRGITGALKLPIILVATMAGAILAGLVGSLRHQMLTAVAAIASLVALWYAALLHHWWMPLAAPALAWLLSYGLVIGWLSFRNKQQRAELQQLFASNLSGEIANVLWQERTAFLAGGRPIPRHLTATLYFSDIVGFTSVSETMRPERMMEWLQSYMEAATTAIREHHGVVLKYIGDAVFAGFGVPIERLTTEEIRRDAEHALEAALAVDQALRRLNPELVERGLPAVRIRIGIYTGEIVSGSIGDRQRMEYSVFGDPVNTASRLEALGKDKAEDEPGSFCRILVGETTVRLLAPEAFAFREVGQIPIRGKTVPVSIYQLLTSGGST